MNNKTILLLNLRFAEFYSGDLFKELKREHHTRLVTIIDQQFLEKIPPSLTPYLDQIYHVRAPEKDGFLAEFIFTDLCSIVETELAMTNNLSIVCTDEFNLINAGRLRKKYNLKGHTNDELLPYRDKLIMKQKLVEHGIRVPKHKKLEINDCFESIRDNIGVPFILKPIDSCGSHGIHLIHNESELNHYLDQASTYDTIEAEEYINGTLYHVDSISDNNDVTFICVNVYSYPNFEFTNGKTLISMPLDNSWPVYDQLMTFAKKCLQALNTRSMVNHMEIFVKDNGECVFLEVSARPPGALLNATHSINFGVNFTDEDLFIQTGLRVNLPAHKHRPYALCGLVPLLSGKIVNIHQPVVCGNLDMKWHVSQGDIIKKSASKNIVNKAGQFILYAASRAALRHDFELLKNYKFLEVLPC